MEHDTLPPLHLGFNSRSTTHRSTTPPIENVATEIDTKAPLQIDVPLSNMHSVTEPEPSHVNPNTDLEAGLAEPEPTLTRHSSELPPEYKEQDMAEPLPPYMTRVRGVMRGQQPIAAAMPMVERRTGYWVVASFILAVLIIVGVGIGVRVANDNSNAPPP